MMWRKRIRSLYRNSFMLCLKTDSNVISHLQWLYQNKLPAKNCGVGADHKKLLVTLNEQTNEHLVKLTMHCSIMLIR